MRKSMICLLGATLTVMLSADAWGQAHFFRGDGNRSGRIDLSDGVYALNWLFSGGVAPPCLDAADINDSGEVDIADAIYTFNWLFLGGASPAAPWPFIDADPTDDDDLPCLSTQDVSGEITTNTTWTNDKAWRLAGAVFVKEGATLTIQRGTTVLGGVGLQGGEKPVIVIERGARLLAVGTEEDPIIFTSEKPVGSRQLGDWGGVILLGRGTINVPGGEAIAEGLVGQQYGGGASPIDDDDSGQLSYCRIEFGGFPISPDNEVNGLSLFGCGSNTKLDHIQIKLNDDDGFEWFGGAADLKYGLVTFVSDDMFDYSYGWRGRGQHWVGYQRGAAADSGFEVDNSEAPVGTFTDTPRTCPTISNVTLVGTGDPASAKGGFGFLLRRGAGTKLYNFIMQGFKRPGFDLDDSATCDQIAAGCINLDYGVFFDNGPTGNDHWQADPDEPLDGSIGLCSSQNFVQSPNNVIAATSPTGMTKPYDLSNPNFRPQNDALVNPFDPTTLDPFFDAVSYRGGVPPESVDSLDWTKARWISYAQN